MSIGSRIEFAGTRAPARSVVLAVFALVLGLAWAGPTHAAARGPKLALAPKAPLTNSGKLTLAITGDRTLTKRQRYVAALVIDTPPPLLRCAGERIEARSAQGLKKGKVAKLVFAPENHWKTGLWCPGKLKITLEVVTADSVGTEKAKTVPSSLSTPVTVASGTTGPAVAFTPATITLLEGSAMTVSAPGHADRTTPLTGELAARKPGRLIINRDYDFILFGGSLSAPPLAADPLCTPDPEPWPGSAVPTPTVTTAIVHVNRSAESFVELPLDAARLTGCKGKGPAAATTSISLTGTLDSKGLSRLQLHGSVSVALADGTTATITFNPILRIDILDDVDPAPGQ